VPPTAVPAEDPAGSEEPRSADSTADRTPPAPSDHPAAGQVAAGQVAAGQVAAGRADADGLGLAKPDQGEEGPTAPPLPGPAVVSAAELTSVPSGEAATAQSAQIAPAQAVATPTAPDQAVAAETAIDSDHALAGQIAADQAVADQSDGTAGTPLAGISDPPGVAHTPGASAVPSWVPQGPVQAQADYLAPYVATEPPSHNGTAAANGATTVADLALTTPMPVQSPSRAPRPTLQPRTEPLQSPDAMPQPAAQAEADPGATTRRRRSTKRRLPTQKIFSDLATQAAIPAAAYAIGEDVDGAMCLVRTDEGFEVFNAVSGARHEVRIFQDEESAYFYLFGVLVAESVRTGALVPRA
jgi:hypothetical protein